MDNFLIILTALLCAVMIGVILIYNNLDRKRFYMDRSLKGAQPQLDKWAKLCGELSPGSDEAYFQAKTNAERLACIEQMVSTVTENTPEKLELQEDMLDFCYSFNQLADRYNDRLDNALLGPIARRLRFRPYCAIDFYPLIKAPEDPTEPEEPTT